jgi:hypothetical protein
VSRKPTKRRSDDPDLCRSGPGLGGAAAADAGIGAAVLVEELGEPLEHDAAQSLGVSDCHGCDGNSG